MNELERLIAAVKPAAPRELDDRIEAVLQSGISRRDRRRRRLVLCAVALIAAALGFVGGRHSSLAPSAVAPTVPNKDMVAAESHSSNWRMDLSHDQVAQLFIHPSDREGLFGSGLMDVVVSSNP